MKPKKQDPNAWKNRIVGHGEEAPDQLLANPMNFRIHPREQQDAMSGAIAEVGVIQSVIVNKRTGHLIDGHLRVTLALRSDQKKIPVVYVDLSEEEERKALASYDALSTMATIEKGMFTELTADLEISDDRFRDFLEKDAAGLENVNFKAGGERCLCPNCGHDHALRKGMN